ncbi:Hypothetical predicted protein [Cloeon dipterum]|uniref:Peptidase C14A caspase catalytic domain-containing protein n=1 Tax=Cloeon dipterum TaxID=197152 RepID=A0A8S1E142_9INSE|nr:Hypothetical predicted protein [Cloeon dipterum]
MVDLQVKDDDGKNLYIIRDEEEMEALLRFSQIKSLVLLDCPTEAILDRFLGRYGGKLQTLCVCNLFEMKLKYEFRSIFNACPKLETLVLVGVQIVDPKPLGFFAQLRNLQWLDFHQTKTMRLSNVLSGPYLENVYILDSKPDLEDTRQVSFAPFRVAVMPLVKPLCRVCERPTADGAVRAVQLDKEKLQTWLLNVCGYEFAEEIEDEDLICYFCIWNAEFLAKYVCNLEALAWWPPDLDYLDDVTKELRRKYLEGKAEQCWVQLEKIELPKIEKDEHGEHEAMSDCRKSGKKCFYCGQVVVKISRHSNSREGSRTIGAARRSTHATHSHTQRAISGVGGRARPRDLSPLVVMGESTEKIAAKFSAGPGNPGQRAADLGYFVSTVNGQIVTKNADNVCVLVVHYDFKNARDKNLFRDGDAKDVIHLQTTFEENRKCNFRSLLSPKREELLELLSGMDSLLRFFGSKDVPSVFVFYILSHGNRDGKIYTDHYESEDSKEFVSFTTTDIFDSLKNLKLFDDCLKLINLGPCRGDFFDTIYSANHQPMLDNKNSCRITYEPQMRNLVVFYSTVETTRAIRGVSGTAFIREACKVLDSMKEDEPILNVLTSIKNQIHNRLKHNYDVKECVFISQTPEVKMFALNRRFFFSKSSLVSSNSCSSGDDSKLKVESEFFPWKSDSEANVRHRRAFLLFSEPNEEVDKIKKALSENLQFEISERMPGESSLELYFKEVSELEPDVGCVVTFLFGKLSEKEVTREVCCRFGDEDIAMTDIQWRIYRVEWVDFSTGPKGRGALWAGQRTK